MTYRFDIQILRGLAVIFVVLFHLEIPPFHNGFLGVDAFFVISGFLMMILYKPGKALDFYRRRASRLLPAYFATIIATLIASTVLTLPSEHRQVVEQAIFGAFFASNIGFWTQNSYFIKSDFNPLLHLWSLGVEIQFYLIVPLLVWLHTRSRFMLILLGFATLGAALVMVSISSKTAFYMTPFRIWQFLAGAAVAHTFTRAGVVTHAKPFLGFAFLILLLVILFAYPVNGPEENPVFGHPGIAALLVTIATSGVLAFGLPAALGHSWIGLGLQKLGDWSYSIYLAHFPVIVFSLYVPFSGTILQPSGWTQTFLVAIYITAFSLILYKIFDNRKTWSGSFRTTGGATALVCCAAFVSLPASRIDYSSADLKTFDALDDRSAYRCGLSFRVFNPQALLCEVTIGLPDTAPDLVLVGDSHADSVKTSFARVAQDKGFNLHFAVSNSPAIGGTSGIELIDQFLSFDADGIILHYSSANALRVHRAGFHEEIRDAGLEVVWMLDVPVYDDSIPELIWKKVPKKEIVPKNFENITKLHGDLNSDGVLAFDPRSILCDEACVLINEQKQPLYFDGSHLTLAGSRYLEPLMEEIVTVFARDKQYVVAPPGK